ncbi:AmmeMemoRadiSam system protein A [Caloranaerobacter ferrireducens]|uniref:AmmeMemoRadiSam system protein A n=1 Tax=Caloranaerobacter ferrireducens TaxID=1323370 RepID=UPI00084D1015|nr:AmmeMemoRadiSam system protein A [Caloranaerobacter ferrireducens]
MGKILGAYVLPHPPIIIPEIGKGQESKAAKTIRSMKQIASDISKKKPDTIIIVTPHGPLFTDAISILYEDKLVGDFRKFGSEEIYFEIVNNKRIVDNIIEKASYKDIVCAKIDKEFASDYDVDYKLDHGALVPLYFIKKEYSDFNLVHITYGLLLPIELYKFGMVLKQVIEESKENIVFIASGDLSHKLTKDAPSGYNARGKDFDEMIVKLLEAGDREGLMKIDFNFAEIAGECGLRSIMIMCGLLDGYKTISEVISYEYPFGVGYCVSYTEIEGTSKDNMLLDKLIKHEKEKMQRIRENEDEYVRLARESLEYFIKNGKVMDMPADINNEMIMNKAGVFVSIKKDGKLRGCIGTIAPTEENIAKEIIRNAIKAGTEDPRFYPVEEDELERLKYSVDIIKEPEEIDTIEKLDIKKYGVIVRKGYKMGVLLPDLEGVDSPEEQVLIALRKAGIRPDEGYILERFEVIRHCG